MDRNNLEFHEREMLAESDRQRQERDDLQNEMSGRETGRVKRLEGSGATIGGRKAEKEREERRTQTRLQFMLADPAYRALYEEATTALDHARTKTEEALQVLDARLEQIDDKLDALGSEAAGTEQYQLLEEERLRLQRQQQEWLDYQINVLNPAQERLNGPDNPPSKEELEEIRQDIQEYAPSPTKDTLKPDAPAPSVYTKASAISVPTLD